MTTFCNSQAAIANCVILAAGGEGNASRMAQGSSPSDKVVESKVETGDEPVQCLTHILLHVGAGRCQFTSKLSPGSTRGFQNL